jgi:hypothetical protein
VTLVDDSSNSVGAPSLFTQKLADEICERVANKESVVKIFADPHMPNISTVFRWMHKYEEFRANYARAKEVQAEVFADEIVSISDTCRIGEKRTVKADGTVEVVTGDMVERSRLQVDARKWVASKLLPKKYGDKTTLVGADDGPIKLEVQDVKDKLRARLLRRTAPQPAGE